MEKFAKVIAVINGKTSSYTHEAVELVEQFSTLDGVLDFIYDTQLQNADFVLNSATPQRVQFGNVRDNQVVTITHSAGSVCTIIKSNATEDCRVDARATDQTSATQAACSSDVQLVAATTQLS